MIRAALTVSIFLTAGPAAAHLGHLGEVAGHAHWVAGAAIGLAGAIALWAGTRGRAEDRSASEDAEGAAEDTIEEASEA